MSESHLTAARLRDLLHYDRKTGFFTWRITKANHRAGTRAGTKPSKAHPYKRIGIDGFVYQANRLAWLYVTGEWPKHEVDHWNGVKSDDAWINLRDVDHGTNQENRRTPGRNNRIGLLGVKVARGGKFSARLQVKKVRVYLGVFDTAPLAHAAYVEAKRLLHKGCTI